VSTYITILTATLPVFLVLGAGYVARVLRILTPEGDSSIMKLVINVLYPALILSFILGNEALREPSNIGFGLALGGLSIMVGVSLAYIVAPLGEMRVGTGRRTFAFATGLHNYGYIAIPLTAALFGAEGTTVGVLLVYNVGVEAAVWTFGMLVLRGGLSGDVWKKLLNPPVVAMLIGLALNFAGTPEMQGAMGRGYAVALAALKMLGACAIPLGLIISGATLRDLVATGEWLGRPAVPILGVACRNVLLPVVFLAMAFILPLTPELRRGMAVQAAMPAAMLPIVLARFYGGSPSVAVQVVVASTLAGLLSIPFWLTLGLRVLK